MRSTRSQVRTEEMSDAVETGYRTKKGTDLVAKQIKALAPDKDALKLAQKVIADAGIKSDDKGTKALFSMITFVTLPIMTRECH